MPGKRYGPDRKKVISVKVDDKTHKALAKWAEVDVRTLSDLCFVLLREAIKNREETRHK